MRVGSVGRRVAGRWHLPRMDEPGVLAGRLQPPPPPACKHAVQAAWWWCLEVAAHVHASQLLSCDLMLALVGHLLEGGLGADSVRNANDLAKPSRQPMSAPPPALQPADGQGGPGPASPTSPPSAGPRGRAGSAGPSRFKVQTAIKEEEK